MLAKLLYLSFILFSFFQRGISISEMTWELRIVFTVAFVFDVMCPRLTEESILKCNLMKLSLDQFLSSSIIIDGILVQCSVLMGHSNLHSDRKRSCKIPKILNLCYFPLTFLMVYRNSKQ